MSQKGPKSSLYEKWLKKTIFFQVFGPLGLLVIYISFSYFQGQQELEKIRNLSNNPELIGLYKDLISTRLIQQGIVLACCYIIYLGAFLIISSNSFQNLFVRRLNNILTFFTDSKKSHTKRIITLEKSKSNLENNEDEIDDLVNEINHSNSQYNDLVNDLSVFSTDLELKVRERTKELEEKNSLIEESLNKNKTLLRIVFHDIANPMTIIKNSLKISTKLLTQGAEKNQEKLERKLAAIMRAANNISEILSQVKQLEALKTGKIEVELTPVNLEEIIENAIFTFENRLAEKSIDFRFNNNLNGEEVMAEKVSLSNNVVNNILSNAIKFSEEKGKIEVSASIEGDKILLTLSDNGIGIPDDILSKLFDSEAKTSRPGTKGEAGTGFGMPIVKSYMEMYQGEIVVKSKVRKKDEPSGDSGTTFELRFKKAA